MRRLRIAGWSRDQEPHDVEIPEVCPGCRADLIRKHALQAVYMVTVVFDGTLEHGSFTPESLSPPCPGLETVECDVPVYLICSRCEEVVGGTRL
jgi:hypothetical protein